MSRSRTLAPAEASFLLAALTVLVHGVLFPWKGFYMDDWRFIQLWESAPARSLWALMTAFNENGFCFYRPLDIPYFTIQYWLFGRAGWAYQALQLGFNVAAVLLLHAAWRRATGDAALSFAAAVIFAVYPNHSSTHHWLSSPFAATAALFALALLLQLDAARRRKTLPAVAAAVVFSCAILTYEAVLPLAVLFPALCALRLRLDGLSARASRAGAALSCIPLVIGSAASLLYQQVLIPRLFPVGQTRPMELGAGRFLKVFGRAFECTTTGIVALAADSARNALSTGLWLLLPAVALAAAAGIYLWRRSGAGGSREAGGHEWIIGAAAAWAASYAPLAVSAQGYMPHIFDEQNRLNAAGTVGASMLGASGLLWVGRSRPRLAAGLFAAFVAVSSGIDWVAGVDYMRAWDLQKKVLSSIASQLPPGPADVALSGVPSRMGRAAGFHADWEFACALAVWTRRTDLTGRMEPGEPVPGRRNFVYRYPEGVLEEIPAPRSR